MPISGPYTASSSTDTSFFSGSPVQQTTTRVIVKTRTIQRPRPPVLSPAKSASPASNTNSRNNISRISVTPNPKKRKAALSCPGPSESDMASKQAKRIRANDAPKRVRKPHRKKKESSRSYSRDPSRQSSPEPIFRNTSDSLFPPYTTHTRSWTTQEDGTPGEAMASSEKTVRDLIKTYRPYFQNIEPERVVELEYPNTGAVERFLLLEPKDKQHYNPIYEIENIIHTIYKCYLNPEQQALFGTIPSENPYPTNQTKQDLNATIPSINVSDPDAYNSDANNDSIDDGSCSSMSDDESYLAFQFSSRPPKPKRVPPIDHLQLMSIAIKTRNGPLFVQVVESINKLMRTFKYPTAPNSRNLFLQTIDSWKGKDLPRNLLIHIIEENYQRSVGPHINSLRAYEAFTNSVYGELMPKFSYDIITKTQLREDSIFMDLGSGVGNIVSQAALQSGCKAYGIELMSAPSKVARNVTEQIRTRARMWGLAIGDMELDEGDMLTEERVSELLPQADVVLIDNKAFNAKLNESLKPMFLDLKEGALIISLVPFSSPTARVTDRNLDDMSTIFEVHKREYPPGSVSWGPKKGDYFIHKVDRDGYAKIRECIEQSRVTRNNRRS